jgi:F0F1-type ATP synthase assembly protein I
MRTIRPCSAIAMRVFALTTHARKTMKSAVSQVSVSSFLSLIATCMVGVASAWFTDAARRS